jgi:hypothetical protein
MKTVETTKRLRRLRRDWTKGRKDNQRMPYEGPFESPTRAKYKAAIGELRFAADLGCLCPESTEIY